MSRVSSANTPIAPVVPQSRRLLERPMLLVALALGALGLRFATLGLYPVMDRTEARYAEIAREMLATGNWLTPQLDPGVPYWGKPPLTFWLTASSYRLFGVDEFAARLPALLASLLTLWLVYRLGREIGGPGVAALGSLILATTALFLALAGSVTTDPALTAGVTLSLAAFALAVLSEDPGRRRRWGLAFFAGLGLSLLAKGPVGWALIGFPLGAWILWTRKDAPARGVLPWKPGLALAAAIGLPWFAWAELRTPGFLEYFLIGEQVQRFLASGWVADRYGLGRDHPFGAIWIYLALGTLPWCVPAAIAAVRGRRTRSAPRDPWLVYALLWMLAPAIFFTPARNLLATYVLPGLPGFALASALLLAPGRGTRDSSGRNTRLGTRSLLLISSISPLLLVASIPVLRSTSDLKTERALVARFEELASYERAELWYYEVMPKSAEFYSRGRTRLTVLSEPKNLTRQLRDGRPDFFAVPIRHLPDLPPELLAGTDEVGRFEGRVLLRERSAGAARWQSSVSPPRDR